MQEALIDRQAATDGERAPPLPACRPGEGFRTEKRVSVESVVAGGKWDVLCCGSSDRKSMFNPQ